jgi:hypothetical protein
MTDVPVSRLNNRLARYLPAELPLGLVFVIGYVENVRQEGVSGIWFDLIETEHRIRCQLSERAAAEFELNEGERIRAGGHLAFDRHRADYYLLARDIELVAETPIPKTDEESTGQNGLHKPIGRQALTPILADIKRRAEATDLEQAQLPYWVQRLAPPEVKEELAQLEPAPKKAITETQSTLDDKLVATLSQAMDSSEDVELTSDMLGDLGATAVPPPPSSNPQLVHKETTRKTSQPEQTISRQTAILLIVVVFLLLLVMAVFVITSLN